MTSTKDKNGIIRPQKKDPIDNPYRPDDIVSGKWPHHDNVIKQIKEIFADQPEKKFVVLQGNPGSGKTSLLKRIECSPQMLGENYIPVYLDSKKYMDYDNHDNLLFAVYRDIIERLREFGVMIAQADYIKDRRIKGKTLESYLLTIDTFTPNKILLLMFDEFDNLLENANIKVISECIQYIQEQARSWSNFALIFTGDRKLDRISSDGIINGLLGLAFPIALEEEFDDETIKRLIIEPLKDRFTYDEEAIGKIIWYSGKNLYFQQLICYYVVNDLNKESRPRCSVNDVEEAVQRILNDSKTRKRPEFTYGWENKLSLETRLILAALADESVTGKREDRYFLKENPLLEDMFGNKLFEKIAKLHDFGYIKPMERNGFGGFPLKIPLYGIWIQREHPFLRTIFEEIPDKVNLPLFIKELEKTPENELIPFDKKPILEITGKWVSLANAIREKKDPLNKIAAEKSFFEGLSSLLNLKIKGDSEPKANYYIIDIKKMNIGIMDEAFCFIQDKPDLTKSDISAIERIATGLAQDTLSKLTLFIHLNISNMVEDIVQKTYLNLVTFDENDLKKIMLSENPLETFRRIILSRLSLQKVSPYQTAGPAKTTFYGRSDIINQISRSSKISYAIVGARKIGKSSLLHKIKDNPPPHTDYIFMILETEFFNIKTYTAFLKSLKKEIEKRLFTKVNFNRFPFGKDISKLPEIFKQLSARDNRIILILDEIDSLIELDRKNGHKLMRIFRTMSEENYCQFVIAGFKELYNAKRNLENPLYNFLEEIMLAPLDRSAALDLITKPMESIGVHYKNKDDRELILEYTACHPSILQFFCKQLVKKIEQHDKVENRRTIFIEDIEELIDTVYEKYIMDEVYLFYSDLTDIDKLILMLIIERHFDEKQFSLHEIRKLLTDQGIPISINDMYRELSTLVMRFILREVGSEKYKFALSVFPEILKKRVDRYFKNTLIEEVKRNARESL